MNDLAAKFGKVELSSLIFLLICLCSSRGEGLHLLPFGGDFDVDAPTALEYVDGHLYQLSKAPERSFSTDLRPDLEQTLGVHELTAVRLHLTEPPLQYGNYADTCTDTSFTLSKRQLTGSSDRSPPASLSA